jgi:hypothetical protein
VNVYTLFVNLEEGSGSTYAAIRTLVDNSFSTGKGWQWLPIADAVSKSHLQSSLGAVLARLQRYERGEETDVFGKYSWLDQFADWFGSTDDTPVQQLRHLNSGPFFCLLHITTKRDAYWFKAVGCDNLREYPATVFLHGHWETRAVSVNGNWPSATSQSYRFGASIPRTS